MMPGRIDWNEHGVRRGARVHVLPHVAARGEAVHVDPMKPMLKAPGCMLLIVRYNGPLSNLAFNFILRRYTAVKPGVKRVGAWYKLPGIKAGTTKSCRPATSIIS